MKKSVKDIVKFEKELIKLKFKRKWLDDKSGYWFEKDFKFKNLKLRLYSEPDRGILHLSIFAHDFIDLEDSTYSGRYYGIEKFPCTMKQINKILKQYGN